ncbi:MAG: response regulator [Patescibacteria group bacterium]
MNSSIPQCILVAEDDDMIWELGIRKLFTVLFPISKLVRARNEAEVYIAIANQKPDLITMDGTLADGSQGLAIARELRTLDIQAPIVMLSAAGMSGQEIREAGAQAYCLKMDMSKKLPGIFAQLGFATEQNPGRSH